jgi:hypothetical protein
VVEEEATKPIEEEGFHREEVVVEEEQVWEQKVFLGSSGGQ